MLHHDRPEKSSSRCDFWPRTVSDGLAVSPCALKGSGPTLGQRPRPAERKGQNVVDAAPRVDERKHLAAG